MPRVQVGDVNLYYESWGEGVPTLFFSGTGWTGEHWKLLQAPYFQKHFRVILHDYRGTGRSDKPAMPYATRLFAQDARGLLDALEIHEPVHMVGHSMGGRVAQWMALDYPERVRSLVLVASGSGQLPGTEPQARGVNIDTICQLVEWGWPAYMEERHLKSRFMFLHPEPSLVEAFVRSHQGSFGTDLASYLRHVIARQEHETTARLSEIHAPTLVIVGEADTVAGGTMSHVDSSRYLADHIPGAAWHVVPNAAHMVFLEQAAAFNQVVGDFLAAH